MHNTPNSLFIGCLPPPLSNARLAQCTLGVHTVIIVRGSTVHPGHTVLNIKESIVHPVHNVTQVDHWTTRGGGGGKKPTKPPPSALWDGKGRGLGVHKAK